MHKAKKIISKIFTTLLIGIMLFFILVSVVGRVSAPSNYGVPSVFGYQSMLVLTDSMEPTYMAGKTGIIAQKVGENEIKEGDVITFYASTAPVNPITHRVVALEDYQGKVRYRTLGDKRRDEILATRDITASDYDAYITTIDVVLGKVILDSEVLGSIFSFTSSTAGFITIVVIPCILVFIINIKDLLKEKKKVEHEEEK